MDDDFSFNAMWQPGGSCHKVQNKWFRLFSVAKAHCEELLAHGAVWATIEHGPTNEGLWNGRSDDAKAGRL